MRFATILGISLCASGCAAGVTGTYAPVGQLGTSSLVAPRHIPLLYAGGPNTNEVDVYQAFLNNPAPRGRILTALDAPTGIAVDGVGNVYVCNNAGQVAPAKSVFWTVTVYHRGQTNPFRTYTDGVFSPVDVAVASDSTVYIANYSSAVTVYASGSVHPARTLQGPSGYAPVGVALDAAGDAFVSYVPKLANGGLIYKYKPGKTQGTNLGIAFTASPHGLAIDSVGDRIVAVSNAPSPGSSIEVFAPGQRHPKLTITGLFQPFMVALSRGQTRLFAADYGSGNNDGAVFVFTYPTGKLLFKDTQGTAAGAYGVALDPSASP
jgi:hypothetical protein